MLVRNYDRNFWIRENISSRSRIECNFNQIKHRIFKNDILPLRVDSFLKTILEYNSGDQLLLQADFVDEDIIKLLYNQKL